MYTIEIKSDYEELYRYNIIVTCAGYGSDGDERYVVGRELIYSEEIRSLAEPKPLPPAGFKVGEPLTLECDDAVSIHAIVYVITNSLPKDRAVTASPPFPLVVVIRRGDEVIYDTSHEVNQWGGATIDIKI